MLDNPRQIFVRETASRLINSQTHSHIHIPHSALENTVLFKNQLINSLVSPTSEEHELNTDICYLLCWKSPANLSITSHKQQQQYHRNVYLSSTCPCSRRCCPSEIIECRICWRLNISAWNSCCTGDKDVKTWSYILIPSMHWQKWIFMYLISFQINSMRVLSWT